MKGMWLYSKQNFHFHCPYGAVHIHERLTPSGPTQLCVFSLYMPAYKVFFRVLCILENSRLLKEHVEDKVKVFQTKFSEEKHLGKYYVRSTSVLQNMDVKN